MQSLDNGAVNAEQIGLAFASFFVVSIGGFLIGVIFALLTSFITKFTEHVTGNQHKIKGYNLNTQFELTVSKKFIRSSRLCLNAFYTFDFLDISTSYRDVHGPFSSEFITDLYAFVSGLLRKPGSQFFLVLLYNTLTYFGSIFHCYTPHLENVRKPKVFRRFQELQKWNTEFK